MTRRKRFSAEFKREAWRRADQVGVSDVLVAEELGIDAGNCDGGAMPNKDRVKAPFPVRALRAIKS